MKELTNRLSGSRMKNMKRSSIGISAIVSMPPEDEPITGSRRMFDEDVIESGTAGLAHVENVERLRGSPTRRRWSALSNRRPPA